MTFIEELFLKNYYYVLHSTKIISYICSAKNLVK